MSQPLKNRTKMRGVNWLWFLIRRSKMQHGPGNLVLKRGFELASNFDGTFEWPGHLANLVDRPLRLKRSLAAAQLSL